MTRLIAWGVVSMTMLAAQPQGAVAVSTVRSEAETRYDDAVRALADKDYPTALSKFEEALSADPDDFRYGSAYRQAVIKVKEYDRCLKFFETLVTKQPNAPNAYLNYGFAYVDKIPDVGAISQLILANSALPLFNKSLELRPSWLGYSIRGTSYMYWPKALNRTEFAIADLSQALRMQQADAKRDYHVRTYVSLGDAYWKMDKLQEAQAVWREGMELFPGNSQLRARLARTSEELKATIDDTYDPNKRIDTRLQEFW